MRLRLERVGCGLYNLAEAWWRFVGGGSGGVGGRGSLSAGGGDGQEGRPLLGDGRGRRLLFTELAVVVVQVVVVVVVDARFLAARLLHVADHLP